MISIPLINFKSSTSVVSIKFALSKTLWRAIRFLFFLFLLTSFLLYWIRQFGANYPPSSADNSPKTRLILITPTHLRVERLADLTRHEHNKYLGQIHISPRLSQTLMHVNNVDWILIEDGPKKVEAVERILKRSNIAHTYLVKQTEPGYPGRGWPQRNFALDFVRKVYANYKNDAVIYFLDDDNTYDLRLFRDYLPKVKTIGLWAVGKNYLAKKGLRKHCPLKDWSGMDSLKRHASKIRVLLDGMLGKRQRMWNLALTWPDLASIWT